MSKKTQNTIPAKDMQVRFCYERSAIQFVTTNVMLSEKQTAFLFGYTGHKPIIRNNEIIEPKDQFIEKFGSDDIDGLWDAFCKAYPKGSKWYYEHATKTEPGYVGHNCEPVWWEMCKRLFKDTLKNAGLIDSKGKDTKTIKDFIAYCEPRAKEIQAKHAESKSTSKGTSKGSGSTSSKLLIAQLQADNDALKNRVNDLLASSEQTQKLLFELLASKGIGAPAPDTDTAPDKPSKLEELKARKDKAIKDAREEVNKLQTAPDPDPDPVKPKTRKGGKKNG